MPTDRLLRMVSQRHQHTLDGIDERGRRRVMTRSRIGLPYFASPILEERRFAARFDEIAFGERSEQAHRLTLDLPPMMNDALKGLAPRDRCSPSRRSMSRTASATTVATSNIVRACQMLPPAALG